MDSLTQIVLGAAVGETILGRKIGNKAILWGAIAGTIPDLDVMVKLFTNDIVTANEMHRGFSHSIIFCVLFAPLFGWLLSKLYKKQKATWKDWTKLMFWGLFTHPILDAFTTWGTQLFWPLNYKVSFKNIFVIDPLYTIPFLFFLVVAMCYKRDNPKRKKFNLLGIYISSGYMLITLLLKWYTYGVFKKSLDNQDITYAEIQTKPSALNTILWNANIETKDAYLIGNYSLFDKDKNIEFSEFKKNYHLLNDLEEEKIIKRLIKLTQGWYTLQQADDNNLYFNDLRFGLMGIKPNTEKFVFRYKLSRNQNGKLIANQENSNPKDIAPLLKELWNRIWGKESI